MYCLFYKDHSSVYVQCAAANGQTNPAGADAGLFMQYFFGLTFDL